MPDSLCGRCIHRLGKCSSLNSPPAVTQCESFDPGITYEDILKVLHIVYGANKELFYKLIKYLPGGCV